jgi:hypothetical protein
MAAIIRKHDEEMGLLENTEDQHSASHFINKLQVKDQSSELENSNFLIRQDDKSNS